MSKRPSLFAVKPANKATFEEHLDETAPAPSEIEAGELKSRRPPSREDKRIFSVYLSEEAWRQLHRLAFDLERPKQALGEEAVALLFEKYRLNRIS